MPVLPKERRCFFKYGLVTGDDWVNWVIDDPFNRVLPLGGNVA